MTRVALLKALACPTRMRILLCILASGEHGISVQAIENTLDTVSQCVISVHLRILRDAGLVAYEQRSEQKKRWHHYACTRPDEVRALLHAADVLRKEAVNTEKEQVVK